VTAKRTVFASDNFQSFVVPAIARINHQTQCPVQRHRTGKTWIQCHQRASGVTRAAIDALGLIIQFFSFLARMRNSIKIILIQIVARHERRHCSIVGVEKRFQVNRQIARHGKISQRFDFQIRPDIFDERAASQLLAAIHHHRTRTAHPNATGKAKGQIGNCATLQHKERVENAGAFAHFDFVRLEMRLSVSRWREAFNLNPDLWHWGIIVGQNRVANGFENFQSRATQKFDKTSFMKNLILLASLSSLVCGCETFKSPEPDAIKVEVRGTPGLKFTGTYSLDGREQQVCGVVPMDIETVDGKFSSVFKKQGDGLLTVIVNKNGKQYSQATSVTELGGVEAKISPGELFDITSANGF
jgi:hypothetical protein